MQSNEEIIKYPVYKDFAGCIKILSAERYIQILDYRIEMNDNELCVDSFLSNGRQLTEQQFNDAFQATLTRFTNILSEITQQKFIDSTEPATEDDCRECEDVAYEIYERNYDLQEALNDLR